MIMQKWHPTDQFHKVVFRGAFLEIGERLFALWANLKGETYV